MKRFRKALSVALCAALTFSCVPAALAQGADNTTKVDVDSMTPEFYTPNANNWLYFGWENHDHKSLSTMGGALYSGGANPGKGVRRMADSGMRTPPDDPSFPNTGIFDEKAKPIRYTVTVGDTEYVPDETSPQRRQNTKWYQADGYMNSPVSEWAAGDTGISVKIQHVVNEVTFQRNGQDTQGSVTFSQVTLRNATDSPQTAVLNVSALSDLEVPLNATPAKESRDTSKYFYPQSDDDYALYLAEIPAQGEVSFDFAATVWNNPSPSVMKTLGSFDENYAAVKAHYDAILDDMALPVSLPDEEMTNSYINSMIVMWETMVKATWNKDDEMKGQADYQIRGSAATQAKALNGSGYMHGYDTYFPHDVPNMVEQFIRDGRLELAMRIMDSPNYQTLYLPENHGGNLDAVPKFIIPYATLWQVMDSEQRDAYFTDEVKNKIKTVAKEITTYITEDGIIQKSESLDNMPYDYLVVDNFTALHGFAAYRYLCEAWGWTDEAAWTDEQMTSLNNGLNAALDDFMQRNDTEWYMCAMNDDSGFWTRHQNGSVIYDGNWISSTLMMSTFPWDAVLRGYDLGGTWADYLDATMDNAVALKNQRGDIPEGSWGAWWGHEYGSVYNVGQSVPLLYSDKYRTSVVESYEWLLDNQTAPFQWAESFDRGLTAGDWTTAAIDYETWGLGFLRQGLLEATASVKTDGTVIIGRGIPNEWLLSSTPIEWQNIAINDGRKFDTLKLYAPDAKTVRLELAGNDAVGDIVLDLPAFKDNIASVSAGSFDNESGRVTVPGNTKELTVTLKNNIATDETIEIPQDAKAQAEGRDIQVTWSEVDGATSYVVKVTAAGEEISEETVVGNTFTLKDAIPGITYSFTVKAVGNAQESAYCDPVTASTQTPAEVPSGEGSITVDSATIGAGSNLDLTEVGTLDWIKTGFGTRGQNDILERKNQDTAYLNRFYFPANGNGDILWNEDIGYTYSWTDGTNLTEGSSNVALNMGAYFGQPTIEQEATVLMVAAPATSAGGNTLIVDIGSWQVTGRIDIFLSDNSAAMQTIRIDPQSTAKYDRYTIQYQVPEGSNASLVVAATIESKAHQAGNIILPAAALQGDPIELESLTLTEPDKKTYLVGEELDLTGLNVTANYTFGDSKPVTGYTVSGFDPETTGQQTITVSYTENGVTKTASFTVTVEAPILTSISVTPPAKTTYIVGEPFEHSGMSVTAHYSNCPDRGVSNYELSGDDTSQPGTKTVTVRYTEGNITKTATFEINVIEKEAVLTGITAEISTSVYRIGDTLDRDSLVVTAHYEGGTSKEVTVYDVSELDSSTQGVKTLTVTYTEGGVTKTTTFDVTVVLPGDVDASGRVTSSDALLALQAATDKVDQTDVEALAADVDKIDGVSSADALMILQYATQKINGFPVEA